SWLGLRRSVCPARLCTRRSTPTPAYVRMRLSTSLGWRWGQRRGTRNLICRYNDMSVERGPARWGAVAVIPGRVVAGGQLVKLHPNCRIATLISRDEVATSAEGMYGSLRHLVKPILEKISVATRTWTASLKPTNSSFVPTSLKTWYPRSLLLTPRHGSAFRNTGGTPIGSSPGDLGCPRRRISHNNLAAYGETPSVMTKSDAHPTADSEGAKGRLEERPKLLYRDRTQALHIVPGTSYLIGGRHESWWKICAVGNSRANRL